MCNKEKTENRNRATCSRSCQIRYHRHIWAGINVRESKFECQGTLLNYTMGLPKSHNNIKCAILTIDGYVQLKRRKIYDHITFSQSCRTKQNCRFMKAIEDQGQAFKFHGTLPNFAMI